MGNKPWQYVINCIKFILALIHVFGNLVNMAY